MGIPRRDRRTSRCVADGLGHGTARGRFGCNRNRTAERKTTQPGLPDRRERSESASYQAGRMSPVFPAPRMPARACTSETELRRAPAASDALRSPPLTNTPLRTGSSARVRARALDPLRGVAQPDDGTDHKGDEAMNREHQNGSQTGVAGALSALKLLLGAAAGLLKRHRGAIQDTPTGIWEAEYRSAEPTAGLHETRSTRKQRGQGRRVDRHEDMDMTGKMSEIDMQGGSGHEDARSQRKATGTRCSAWVRRLAASLFVFTALGISPAGSRADRRLDRHHHPHQPRRLRGLRQRYNQRPLQHRHHTVG